MSLELVGLLGTAVAIVVLTILRFCRYSSALNSESKRVTRTSLMSSSDVAKIVHSLHKPSKTRFSQRVH